MADEHVVFGPKAVEQIAKTVREVARAMQNPAGHRGRWQGRYPITKNCNEVRFQILASDSTTRTALCVILARPYGCEITDIPATVFEGQAIEVCDPSGCFFNETNAMLVGRDGWAKYMLPVSGASWCQGTNPYYGMQPEWEVHSLCCATDSCSL